MSINVTVKGNPVSIKRGKMITTSTDAPFNHDDGELKKRRQMRIQQVRQQSKDIAQNVRNKVRKEKTKQLDGVEEQNSAKLKQWQARKLVELQNQYRECLKDIGMGHNLATEEAAEEEYLFDEKQHNQRKAAQRGFEATQTLQVDKNERTMKSALPAQQKKITRDIENVRASLITNINKTKLSPEKKKRKICADISVSKEIDSSDDDSDDIAIDLIESSDSSKIEEPVKSQSRRKSPVPPNENNKLSAKHEYNKNDYRECLPNKRIYSKQQECGDSSNINSKLYRTNFQISPITSKDSILDSYPTNTTRNSQFMPLDTRISDRIKCRHISSEDTDPFTSTSDDVITKKSLLKEPCYIRTVKTQTTENTPNIPIKYCGVNPDQPNMQSADTQSTRNGFPFDKDLKYVDVPKRPTIGIVNSKDSLSHLHSMPEQRQKFTRVQCYDRKNLYNSEMIMDNTNVQRIQEGSLDVMPSRHEDQVYSETIFKRDRDAEVRGRKAMEKEKVHRDYQELMEKLPVLQKQERIASISKDKPIYHMDKDRFTEHETKRQNKMENTYEQLFPNVITIAPRNRPDTDSNKLPFRTIDNSDDELKVGKWDCCQTSDIHQNTVNSKELQTLLRLLKKQKDTLEELGTLPEETSQQSIPDKLKDDQSVNCKRDKSKKSCKNYKILVLQNTSTQTTPKSENDSRKSSPKRSSESKMMPDDGLLSPKRYKKSQCHHCTSAVDSCKLEKYKNNKKVSVSTSKDVDEIAKTKHIKTNDGVKSVVPSSEKKSCDCDENNTKDGKLCEIRISIQENETPIITVTSPKKIVEKVPLTSQKKPTDAKSTRILNTKPVSWREHLNENSSTSTSYNSPPNFHNNAEQQNDVTYQNESVQNNSAHNRSKKIDRRLMTYIKKLLELSQSQIEELAVSSVSEVSTPSNSMVNSASNNPVNQLMNVMKFFKLSSKDIAYNLNYSNDTPNKSSFTSSTRNESSSTNITGPSDKSSVNYSNDSSSSTMKSTRVSQNLVTPVKSLNSKYAGVVVKYSEMADICHKRISDLTAKIEKVRHEKNQILESHSDSDKENSTTYFNLPSELGQKLDVTPQTSDSSGEQEKLTQMLLDVTRSNTESNSVLLKRDISEGIDDVDKDIVDRYIKLKFDHVAQSAPQPVTSVQIQKTEENVMIHMPFIPLMLDIPRLPKLSVTSIVSNSVKRPPPSKGLTAARKFNDDITAIPHELSTIAEADSAYSGKLTLKTADNSLQQTTSPDYDTNLPPPVIILPESNPPTWTDSGKLALNTADNSLQQNTSPAYDTNLPPPVIILPESNPPIWTVSDAKQSSLSSTEDSMPDLLAELISKVQVADNKRKNDSRNTDTDSSTEKSELESVENMLRNIGMGWAIATLRKTRETLGRTSTSSSSVDLSIHQELVTIDNSIRDSRTEEVVSKHFHMKSTSKSHSDSSSFCKELNDISAIAGTSSSVENKDQRTSTPIQTTKSSDKSKNKDKLFTGESDLSSVQERDGHFLTLPDFTLTESHTKD